MKNTTNKTKSNKTNSTNATISNNFDNFDNLDNLDNLDNQINTLDGIEINIHKLIDDLQNIGDEKNKEEFIKNYSKIKEQIKLVDSILFNNDNEYDEEMDDEENDINDEFETNNIGELLSILEINEDKIFDSSNLTIGELKYLIKICNMLEKKINNETMNIIEIK
jgi:hypothetical protein